MLTYVSIGNPELYLWNFRIHIYNGEVWKDFQNVLRKPFLNGSLGFYLMMNMDWFQPCKHANYSVDTYSVYRYVTVMSLPRSVRFRQEIYSIIILTGILSSLCELKHNLNPYIEPVVDELTA